MAKMADLAKKEIATGLVKISIAKGPFESGDFSENGIFGENGEYGKTFAKVLAKIQIRWQRGPLKVAILTKTANCRQRYNGCMFCSENVSDNGSIKRSYPTGYNSHFEENLFVLYTLCKSFAISFDLYLRL